MKVTQSEPSERQSTPGKCKEIVCKKCKQKLGVLYITETDDVKRASQYICPCGDKSFVITTEKKCFFVFDESIELEKFDRHKDIFLNYMRKKQ